LNTATQSTNPAVAVSSQAIPPQPVVVSAENIVSTPSSTLIASSSINNASSQAISGCASATTPSSKLAQNSVVHAKINI